MRILFVVLCVLCSLWFVGVVMAGILAEYHYEQSIGSYWELSVKASTIEKKSEYLDRFVSGLETAGLADYNALWLQTPDNSAEQNMAALKSLQNRLHEIRSMDVRSFEYQQAISQITQHEQDEAENMLLVLGGAWQRQHHPLLWNWIGILNGLLALVCAVVSCAACRIVWDVDPPRRRP